MMPFLDKIVMRIEKERLPMKSKWRQGYLDEPDLDHLEYGLELQTEARDSDETAAEFKRRDFRFPKTVENVNWYIGFNWLDPIVGKGATPADVDRHRKLRQALQIAVNWEEYSDLFEQLGKPVPPRPDRCHRRCSAFAPARKASIRSPTTGSTTAVADTRSASRSPPHRS